MAGDQLRGVRPGVVDADGIGEHIAVVVGYRLLIEESGGDIDFDRGGCDAGHGVILARTNCFDARAERLPTVCPAARHRGRQRADRESVVTGKRVSVRVEYGGGRIMKKKTSLQNMHACEIY